jgi:hypothetical protein
MSQRERRERGLIKEFKSLQRGRDCQEQTDHGNVDIQLSRALLGDRLCITNALALNLHHSCINAVALIPVRERREIAGPS